MPQKATKRPDQLIQGGDSFALAFAEYTQGTSGRLLSSFLNEKKYTIKDTHQTYRLINHWSSVGLLEDERDDQSKWRKLSTLDVIWIRVLVELRRFGFPLEKLKVVQETLFPYSESGNIIPFFEFAIAQIIAQKDEQFLIVAADGTTTPISAEMLDVNHRFAGVGNYVCIGLNQIVAKVFEGHDFTVAFRNMTALNDDEADVLMQMRSGKCRSVNVKMQSGHIEMIEATETIEAQKKLIDLLKDADYQTIEVKTRDGMVASIKRTVKKKPTSKATGKSRASSTEPLRSSDDPTSDAVHSHAHG